jgi:hypothetical protein
LEGEGEEDEEEARGFHGRKKGFVMVLVVS